MKKWYLYITAFLFLAACVSEHDFPDNPVRESGLTVRIVFPTMNGDGLATKAITDDDENVIDSLDVFVFKKTGANTLNNEFLYRLSYPKDSIHDLGTSPFNEKKVILTLKNMPGVEQHLVFVANIPSGLNLSLTPDVTKESELISQLKFSGAPWRTTPTHANYTRIPMWGQMNDFLTIETGVSLPSSPPTISMIRSLAKIEVGVNLDRADDPALGFGHIFSLDSIFVCNISDSAYVAPHDDYVGATEIGKTKTISNRVECYGFEFNRYPINSKKMANTIYVPETDSLIGTVKPSFLVIRAMYYDAVPAAPYYYRIDFTDGTNYRPILRNHRYTINILNLRMAGYATLEEAIQAPLSDKNYALVLDGTNVSPEINEISVYKDQFLSNAQYMLGVNTSEVIFDWNRRWIGGPTTGTPTDFLLKLYTDYVGGWSASVDPADVSWLTISGGPTSTSAPTASAYDVLHIGVSTMNNTTGEDREGEITLKAGLLTKKIIVHQSGGANSVIVITGSNTSLPLAYVEKARASLGLPNLSVASADVLWQEGISVTGLTVGGGYVNITNPISGTGNAVIALRSSSSEILWSWHIWVLSVDDVNTDFHNPNRSLFMNRLLGNTPAIPRLYYQWGRKDPFRGGFFTTVPVSAASMIASAVQNPNVFYTGVSTSYNWAGTSYFNDNLWNTIEGKKAYSDPCPMGWRVPYYTSATTSPWQNEPSTNWGNYSGTGYISYSTSTPTVTTSSQGYIWASSVFYFYGIYVNVTSSSMNSYSNSPPGYRANGYCVRCVKDISRQY